MMQIRADTDVFENPVEILRNLSSAVMDVDLRGMFHRETFIHHDALGDTMARVTYDPADSAIGIERNRSRMAHLQSFDIK